MEFSRIRQGMAVSQIKYTMDLLILFCEADAKCYYRLVCHESIMSQILILFDYLTKIWPVVECVLSRLLNMTG